MDHNMAEDSEKTDLNEAHDSVNGIRAIDKSSVHRICSGQVVLTLAVGVKELVENSIDAGATSVEIKLKEYGSESIEVSDNGSGVEQQNFHGLTLKHHTSKLQDFSDLVNVETFGFRGEALSSLCALSNLTVITCHTKSAVGTKLVYDNHGNITSQSPCPRQTGTTVCLQNLFHTLPVRHKEFLRNLKKEFAKMTQLLNAYCLINTGVRIHCTNQIGKGSRSVVVATSGNTTLRENIINIFGAKQMQQVLEFKQYQPSEDACTEFGIKPTISTTQLFALSGFISKCEHGQGRSSTDRQFVFINKRPCDSSKIIKVINEVYHTYNRHQYPFLVLNINMDKTAVDVNVTPDKRQIFLQGEKILLAVIKTSLIKLFEPTTCMMTLNQSPFSHQITKESSNKTEGETPKSSASQLSRLKRSFSSAFSQPENNSSPKSQKCPKKQKCLDQFISRNSSFNEDVTCDKPSPNDIKQFLSYGKHNDSSVKITNLDDSYSVSSSPNTRSLDFIIDSPTQTTSKTKIIELQLPFLSESESNSQKFSRTSSVVDSPSVEDFESGISGSVSSNQTSSVSSQEIMDDSVLQSGTSPIKTCYVLKNHVHSNSGTRTLDVENESRAVDERKSSLVNESENNILQSEDTQKRDVLITHVDKPQVTKKREKIIQFSFEKLKNKHKQQNDKQSTGFCRSFRAKISPTDNQSAEDELRREIKKEMFSQMEILGQFNLGFIITKHGDDLFIVDQHATDEKYNFEMLQKNTTLQSQKLIQPQCLELTASNETILADNLNIFTKNGFEFLINEEAPPTQRVRLTSTPVSRNWNFGKEDIEELIFMLTDTPGVMCRPSRVRMMFASRSCRKAVMIGTALNRSEMKRLVCHMGEIEMPWNCPHGRPTMRHLFNLQMLPQT
ncbi:hypothetical protein SNE40_020506 [Patella caerulea]|uniref:Mismatch repair endonuclease PMS2 n=1 Tax=Patella caerulea TaxID=87958 RepID=A0AAN8GE79_PATCE